MEWLPPGWCPRVVAFDIDGTLTDQNKRLDMHAVEALRRLEDAGIPVILATGNVRAITYGLWRFIGLSGPMCCENGGVLWHPDWDEPHIRASGVEAKNAAIWLESQHPEIDSDGIQTNAWRESEWCLFKDEDLELITKSIEASDWSNLDVVRTGFAIHLMEPHLSKGSGLELILERMGMQSSDLLSVGDAPNDLSMFAMSGWSVSVGTPFADVRDAADVVSPYPNSATIAPLVDAVLAVHSAQQL